MTEPAGDGVVQVAYLHDEHVSHSWRDSMRRMRDHDLALAVADGADLVQAIRHGYRIARDPLNMRARHQLAHIRNYAARLFLDQTPHEWLMFVDTDMGFQADAVHLLLEAADPVERPVVGGLCFAHMITGYDQMGGHRQTIVPTMYALGTASNGKGSFCYYGDYTDGQVTPVAATGAAFLLIHRTVLDKLRADVGDHWFDQLYDEDGDIIGEDIAFCARALRAGITPAVHTGVKTTHHKEVWLSEVDYAAQEAVTVRVDPDLPIVIDLESSFAALARNEHDHDGMLKFQQDLDRYEQIIAATAPEVIVETGTHTGASARWFADHGLQVVTIDVNPVHVPIEYRDRVTQVAGSSADPDVVAQVGDLVAGRRCMVTLDSDHSGPHVTAEIDAYGPMVSPGCYLVVEDGIFGYGHSARVQHGLEDMEGSPLDAIGDRLLGNTDWSRDVAIEKAHPISHNPAGYWLRVDNG